MGGYMCPVLAMSGWWCCFLSAYRRAHPMLTADRKDRPRTVCRARIQFPRVCGAFYPAIPHSRAVVADTLWCFPIFPHSFFTHASKSKRYLLLPCCSMLVTEPSSTIVLLGKTTPWNISKNRLDSSTKVPSSIWTVLTQSASPLLSMPGKPWSLMTNVSGDCCICARMLCGVVHTVHVLSEGSKVHARFWCALLLVLFCDAR